MALKIDFANSRYRADAASRPERKKRKKERKERERERKKERKKERKRERKKEGEMRLHYTLRSVI